MYKVFVNEKKLTLSGRPEDSIKSLRFEGLATLEIAVDLLENTSCPEIDVYGENLEEIWKNFNDMFKVLEAAGGVVRNDKDEILFIRRLGKWDLPKGKIEKGEAAEEAAVREVAEETGLEKVILEPFLNNTFHIYMERNGKKTLKKTHWYKMLYVGNEKPTPQIEEGISEVSWKNKEQIMNEVMPMTFKNIKLILNDYWNSNL